jgi:hypothetical protein
MLLVLSAPENLHDIGRVNIDSNAFASNSIGSRNLIVNFVPGDGLNDLFRLCFVISTILNDDIRDEDILCWKISAL